MSIKVCIADDHSIVREGIKTVIQKSDSFIQIVAEAENGREVLSIAQKESIDVYILDISMPLLNGIETLVRLRKTSPKSKVIILSMHDDRISVEKAINSGAKAYILKETAIDEVVRAINEVHLGNFYFSPGISNFIVEGYLSSKNSKSEKAIVELTSKEREIIQLLAEGYTSKDIGQQLNMSFNTVNVHKNHIMQKLDYHKLADLIRFAIKEGIAKL